MPIIPISSASDNFIDVQQSYGPFKAVANIGACTYVSSFIKLGEEVPCRMLCHVLIGRFCSVGGNVQFQIGLNHIYNNVVTTYPFDDVSIAKAFGKKGKNYAHEMIPPLRHQFNNHYQIIIGHDVWIGDHAVIMSGVRIGNGAIIGEKAVVAKSIPPYAIAVGNPARVVKYRFPDEVIKKMQTISWWNWNIEKILENVPLMYDIENFISKYYVAESENNLGEGGRVNLDLTPKLQAGYKVYQFIADYRSICPLWRRVLLGFCQSNFEKAILVIWADGSLIDRDLQEMKMIINYAGKDISQNLIFIRSSNNVVFAPNLLKQATHFITTREMVTLECLKYLYDTDVKIVSALDDNIFENEPPVP